MATSRAVVELVDTGRRQALLDPGTHGLGQILDMQHGETGIRAPGRYGHAAAHGRE